MIVLWMIIQSLMYVFKGTIKLIFHFLGWILNLRAYCKYCNVGRMWTFNLKMTRNSRKGSLLVSWKCEPVFWNVAQFPKNVTRFPENVTKFPANMTKFPEIVTWFSKREGLFFRKLCHIFRKLGHIFLGHPLEFNLYLFIIKFIINLGKQNKNFRKPGHISGKRAKS